jgi:virginiamycin B lyase
MKVNEPGISHRHLVALLAALLILALALAPRAEAFVYWASQDAPGAIGRASLDGTGVENRFIEGTLLSSGVAVDDEHIYWSNDYTVSEDGRSLPAAIGRANLDGTGVNQRFIPVGQPAHVPCGVAVDDSHIYWADSSAHTIGRADLDGTDVNRDFIPDADASCEIAVDGGHLYWTSFAGAIRRADLNGANLDKDFIPPFSTPQGGNRIRGLAVSAAHIYWSRVTVSTSLTPISNTIGRANLNGNGVDQDFLTLGQDAFGTGSQSTVDTST